MKPAKDVMYLNDVKKDTLYRRNVANKPDFNATLNFAILTLKLVMEKQGDAVGSFNGLQFG